MKELVYWLWLSLACTPDTETYVKLREKFSTPKEIYEADSDEIKRAVGSRSRDFNALSDKSIKRAEAVLDFCEKYGVGILTYDDARFPEKLRSIPTPPVLLYYRGTLPDFNHGFYSAIVGTRRLSDYGRRMAFAVGADLASAGAVVVSGMAIGIDGVALAGALSLGKSTVAVLGSGIDVCYPSQHRRLAQEIVKRGCVLTEYAPGTKPSRHNFPKRNRLMSGISDITVVIEGRENSGSIITARHAKKQGRPVYALPGNVDNTGSQVTNLLIKNGAKLFVSADDIVRDYENACPAYLNPFTLAEHKNPRMDIALSEFKVSAVTPSDDIFAHPRREKAKKERKITPFGEDAVQKPDEKQLERDFDKTAISVYKKIPFEGDVEIESLADGEIGLREVMKALLKLEMGRFVVVLPGERVKRNL